VLVAISPVLLIVAFVVILAGTTLFTGMVVELVADVQDGRRDATAGQLLQAATPVIGQLILVGIVAGIGIAIGFVLIIVPGLILLTIWSVAAPVVVLEHPGVIAALGRSRELVRGNGWQAVGDSGGTGVGIVVRIVVQILTAPITALAASVLYFELRGFAGDTSGEAPPPPVAPSAGPLPPATA
jgi:hypothetical protein